jgi:hypothetical protein
MTEEQQYQSGWEYAGLWISHGGKLIVDELPDTWSDAKCNGFSDRLYEARKNA